MSTEEEKAKDRSEYQRRYYQDHRDDIVKQRRSRYNDDLEYRERCKAASRKSRARKREERAGEEPAANRRPVVVEMLDGSEIDAVTVGYVASTIGRSRCTVHAWLRTGVIPEPPFETERGEALFTHDMIEAIEEAIEANEGFHIRNKNKEFHDAVLDRWDALGVPRCE
tara:strand:+ start:5759 stop:6262 length:504 start_codon:yes stop_codon:yes gene_type:complete